MTMKLVQIAEEIILTGAGLYNSVTASVTICLCGSLSSFGLCNVRFNSLQNFSLEFSTSLWSCYCLAFFLIRKSDLASTARCTLYVYKVLRGLLITDGELQWITIFCKQEPFSA